MRKKVQDIKYYLYIFIAGCLWGTMSIFVKTLQACGSNVFYTSFLRMFFSFMILMAVTLIKEGIHAFRIDRKTMVACILLGVFTQAVFNIAYSTAVNRIGASSSAVLLYSAPVFTAVFSWLIFKEKLNGRKCTALLVNIAGCILTATGGHFGEMPLEAMGILIGVSAGFFYSMSAVFGRLTTGGASPLVVTTYNFFFATAALGIGIRPWNMVSAPLSGKIMLGGMLYALISTAFAYVLYFTGVQHIKETSKIPVIASVETVSATMIGIFLFHEKLGAGSLAGIVLVLSSIAVMNGKGRRRTHVR